MSLSRKGIGLILLLLVCLLSLSATSAQDTAAQPVEDLPFADWFILKASSAANWDLLFDEDENLRFTLKLKQPLETDIPEKRILALFTKQSSSYDVAIDRILSIFLSKKIPVTLEAINFKKDNTLGQQALDYARQQNFDLIFSVGSDSTDFVFSNFTNGETIPVVTVTSKDPILLGYLKDYETGSGNNIAYTSLNVRIDLQMIYLQQLIPDLKNIAVFYSETNTSAKETQVEPLRDVAKDYNINVIDIQVKDKALKDQGLGLRDAAFREGVQEQLREIMPGVVAEITRSDPTHQSSIFWMTGTTEVFNEIQTINDLSGKIPVLSAVPDVVRAGGDSAILSIGVSFESNAHLAALYAVDILLGQVKPGDLPVGLVSPPDIAINFMKAREIGLKIPFSFFESASIVYDYEGKLVRKGGQVVTTN
jgi:putative ABC transport system substrate-binding protein